MAVGRFLLRPNKCRPKNTLHLLPKNKNTRGRSFKRDIKVLRKVKGKAIIYN